MLSTVNKISCLLAVLLFVDGDVIAKKSVPDALLGTWQFDSVRTISDILEQNLVASGRDRNDSEIREELNAMMDKLREQASETDSQITIIIDESNFTTISKNTGTRSEPYRVIESNPDSVLIESTDRQGRKIAAKILLLDDTIAIEQPNLGEMPKLIINEKGKEIDSSVRIVVKQKQQGDFLVLGKGSPSNPSSGPRFIYFKRIQKVF